MEENKDLIPDAEIENIQSQEVVADSATTDEVSNSVEALKVKENKKIKKEKKNKKPLSKKQKITIITACSVLGAIVIGLVIWLLVMFLGPSGTQGLSKVGLKVDMTDLPYYIGTEGQFDPASIYPEGVLSADKSKLTYKQDGKTMTKDVVVVQDAVNVNNFEDLVANINAGKAVVIQKAKLEAPKLEGEDTVKLDSMVMNVKNDVYGNGAQVIVNEIVTTRFKGSNGKIGAQTDGLEYETKNRIGGTSVFVIHENDKAVIFQDVQVTGNDMNTEEGGDLAGITEEQLEERGVKLFSGYGDLLKVAGTTDKKANAKIKHCIFENGHKVVHIESAGVIDIEGTIIRNAADTALSIGTFANQASTINSKNNVIESSLTGGIVFYCYTGDITEKNAAASWNTLNIEGFLDIYNWKQEKGLVFMPETEGFADIGNKVAGSTIPSVQYDNLKGYDKLGNKYIHFAIIKLKTGGGVPRNDSKVTGYENIGYTNAAQNDMPDGFPIPDFAKMIAVKEVDVWGYYSNDKANVSPTDSLNERMLSTLYKELVSGRK